MKKPIHIIYYIIMLTLCLCTVEKAYCADTKEKAIDISGKFYKFDDNSKYEIFEAKPFSKIDHTTLGSVSVIGNVTKNTTENNIPSLIIKDDELFSIKFTYNNALQNAKEDQWHIYNDSKKEVNGVKLDDKIKSGAILVQTSFDGKKWVTVFKNTDVKGDATFTDQINSIQLTNGCYYRVILAYETRIEVPSQNVKVIAWETPIKVQNYQYRKDAEVYEFYAKYDDKNQADKSKIETYNLGNTQRVLTDDGFSKVIDMERDDPHLGWDLGQFVIGGYTNNKDGSVFLKNVGDRVTLWFAMDKNADIDSLNKNTHLTINRAENAYDRNMNIPPQDFGRGTLIIKYTDYKGKTHDPIVYTNFLEALASPGADTKVQLFEEGDYTVALDYQIRDDRWLDRLYDYKISFDFKIRNSNTMIYPKDKTTGSYLANDSVTENGFVLDWAKSRYLDVNVRYSRWTKGTNGYTEDVIYNRSAKESDVYDKTGIYTITVTNPTTDPYGNHPTVKKLYVGSDSILIASINEKNASYSVNEIYDLVTNKGYKVTDSGELLSPESGEVITSVTETTTVETTTIETTEETTEETTIEATEVTSSANTERKSPVLPVVICVLAAAVVFVILIIKKK